MVKPPSVEPVLQSRLLPRISFRMMFVLTTVAAVVAATARVAGNGGEVAKALLVGVSYPVLCFAIFALLFLFCWSVSVIRKQSGIAALVIATIFAVISLLGQNLPYLTNWYLIVFLILAGFVLLFVPVRENDDLTGNPFAEGQLPPQILPPREQRS